MGCDTIGIPCSTLCVNVKAIADPYRNYCKTVIYRFNSTITILPGKLFN
jgi:hypothetical protein